MRSFTNGLAFFVCLMCVTVASASTLVVTPSSEVCLYSDDLTTMKGSVTPGGTVTNAKFLDNGNVVVSTSNNDVILYHGYDLSQISTTALTGGVSELLPLSNGNFAFSTPHENYSVQLHDGTTGAFIGQNQNWEASITHLAETTTGNVAFAVDPAGYGSGYVVILDGSTGTALGSRDGWGSVQQFIPLANATGDMAISSTQDPSGTGYPNAWGTMDGTTGSFKYSNMNWDYVPVIAGTANGEIVWSGNTGSGSMSYLYRYAADGTSVASWPSALSDTPLEQIVELANGNIAVTLMWNGKGDLEVVGPDLTSGSYVGSNYGWTSTPFIAAIQNANGDIAMQAVDSSGSSTLQGVWQLDGTNPSAAFSSAGSYPDIVDIAALPNGNMLFSTSGGDGSVVLWTTGTDATPTVYPSSAWFAVPEIAAFEDNYTLFWSEYTNGQWYVYAGDGENGAFNLGELTGAGSRPLFADHTTVDVVPEPSTGLLLLIGLATYAFGLRRKT